MCFALTAAVFSKLENFLLTSNGLTLLATQCHYLHLAWPAGANSCIKHISLLSTPAGAQFHTCLALQAAAFVSLTLHPGCVLCCGVLPLRIQKARPGVGTMRKQTKNLGRLPWHRLAHTSRPGDPGEEVWEIMRDNVCGAWEAKKWPSGPLRVSVAQSLKGNLCEEKFCHCNPNYSCIRIWYAQNEDVRVGVSPLLVWVGLKQWLQKKWIV